MTVHVLVKARACSTVWRAFANVLASPTVVGFYAALLGHEWFSVLLFSSIILERAITTDSFVL